MFTEMQKLNQEDKSIDIHMLLERLYDKTDYEDFSQVIMDLDTKGNIHHFDTYERELVDRYIERRTKQTLSKHIDNLNTDTLIEELESIQDNRQTQSGDMTSLYMRLHEEPYKPETVQRGISTGFITLDRKITFVDTELTIVAARPSIGKTALMIKFVSSCLENGQVPLVFTLEMTEESLARRLIAQRINANSRLVRHSSLLTDSKRAKWQESVAWLSERPHRIYSEIRTIPEIRTKVRQAKRDRKSVV